MLYLHGSGRVNLQRLRSQNPLRRRVCGRRAEVWWTEDEGSIRVQYEFPRVLQGAKGAIRYVWFLTFMRFLFLLRQGASYRSRGLSWAGELMSQHV